MSKTSEVQVIQAAASACVGELSVFVEKANATYSVDFDSLPAATRARIVRYGLTQLLSDAAAPVATTASIDGRRIPKVGKDLADATMKAKALVDQRFSDLSAGILKRVRESSVDPVSAEARRIAIGRVRVAPAFVKWLTTNNLKPTDKDAVAKLATLAGPLAERPDIRAEAERRLNEVAELEIDIEV